jgi:hypothetical protein
LAAPTILPAARVGGEVNEGPAAEPGRSAFVLPKGVNAVWIWALTCLTGANGPTGQRFATNIAKTNFSLQASRPILFM